MNPADPRERFRDLAGEYARHRPGYPQGVVDACARYGGLKPGAGVVDVGCGTGISARLFAARGYRVTGVDPSPEMLAEARAAGGGPHYVLGEAAATGLATNSADLIVAAQALHWFDMPLVLGEWQRLLRPGAACAALWNYRRGDGWQSEFEALLLNWSSEYAVMKKASGDGEDNSNWVKASARCVDHEEHEFANAQSLDLEGLLGRAASSSYVRHGVADRAGFERALRSLFSRHAVDGRLTFAYRTYLLLWRIAPAAPDPARGR